LQSRARSEGVEEGTEKADYDYEHEHEHERLSRQVTRVQSIKRPLLFVLVLVLVIGFFDPFSKPSLRARLYNATRAELAPLPFAPLPFGLRR